MRPSNKSRSRNKSSGGNQRQRMGNIINRVFESAGPDGKVRGTPQQIIDKYNALARDAQVSGDRVAAENHLQHSEHYSRLLGEAQRQQQEQRQTQERDEAQRPDGQRSETQQPDPQRHDSHRESSEASGLTTIDPHEAGEDSGPVETPESRQPSMNGSRGHQDAEASEQGRDEGSTVNGSAAAREEADAPPAKRPRTRKRAKPEAESREPSASVD
jgi:hypothetical protein